MAGEPDGLERLWTPHRLAYVVAGAAQPVNATSPRGCPFCRAKRGPDADGLVVARGATVFALLNLYPYNPGHLMVLPYRHVADFTDLDPAETVELSEFTQTAMRVIRAVSSPPGFNLGMNQGAVAGAGIAAHLHQHVVPRWSGDTNFMPVIGRTKTLPQLLEETRALLASAWPGAGSAPARPARRRAPKAAPPAAAATPSTAAPVKRTAAPTRTAAPAKRTAAAPAEHTRKATAAKATRGR